MNDRVENATARHQPKFARPAVNDALIDLDGCQQISRVAARNSQYCTTYKCACSWRLCRVCIVQGAYSAGESRVVDKETGLCRFHTDEGESATRGSSAPLPPKPQGSAPSTMPNTKDLVFQPKVLGTIISVQVDRVRPMPGQPRAEFDKLELELLAASMKGSRQILPVLLTEVHDDPDIDYQLVDGERRWRACKIGNIPEIVGIVYEGLSIDDAKQLYATSVIANFGRSEHSPLERAIAARTFMTDYNMTLEQVAVLFSRSVATLRSDMRILKLCPEVHALMSKNLPESRRLTQGSALRLVDYPADFQTIAAKAIVEKGLDANKAAHFIRKLAVERRVQTDRKRLGRRTSDDATNVGRGLAHVGRRLETFLHLPGSSVQVAFGRSKPATRKEVLITIEELERKLAEIKEGVRQSGPLE